MTQMVNRMVAQFAVVRLHIGARRLTATASRAVSSSRWKNIAHKIVRTGLQSVHPGAVCSSAAARRRARVTWLATGIGRCWDLLANAGALCVCL